MQKIEMFMDFIKDERGWITWLWSKMGVMLAFFVMLLIFVLLFNFINQVNKSDEANQICRQFADTAVQIYSGSTGLETTFELPALISGSEYNMWVLDKGDTSGVIIHVYKDSSGSEMIAKGGASFPVPLESYDTLHDMGDGEVTLKVRNTGDEIRIERI